MSQRATVIEEAKAKGANISALCRLYGISRKTAYKWLKREQARGAEGLADQSRRPKHSPQQTEPSLEAQVLKVREAHPVWGGRKIRRVIQDAVQGNVPSASTITAILQRNQRIDPEEARKHKPYQRFERERPNELWQMDFKGFFALALGGYCHPLTVLDDHSRFLVGLKACPNQMFAAVQGQLISIFRHYGLPEAMLMDNGAPWGSDASSRYTILTAWLLRMGISISHGRPYHPQTQGKDERLNRTLLAEVISQHPIADLADCQSLFDQWQQVYNEVRPHEALHLATPISCYQPSPRPFPEVLPPVTYEPGALIRKVDQAGRISFHNHTFRVGKAFRYQPVAIHPTEQDGRFEIFFCKQVVAKIDLHEDNDC
jgi:transposase InsO family protein